MSEPVPYLFLGSPPVGPIALRVLELADYPPARTITDTRLTTEQLIEAVEDCRAAFILVVGYGKILKRPLLDSVAGQVLNIHPSLLPLYRGPAPVVQAILDGARETGVSVMEIDTEMDHGPILAQERYPLSGRETPAELYQILISQGTRLFLDCIEPYLAETLEPTPQNHAEATYTHFMKKEDGQLNFSLPARTLERQIRAYQGWPGSWVLVKGKRLIVHQAHLENDQLHLDAVQPEGGKVMSFAAYANGQRQSPAELLAQLYASA